MNWAAANAVLHKSKIHNHTHFLAHGMGLVSHEAPRLTNAGPVPYDAYDAERPLESGMVISVETTLQHPQRGFIKLEDTVVVTANGHEVYGDRIRGWIAPALKAKASANGLQRVLLVCRPACGRVGMVPGIAVRSSWRR